MAAEKPHVERSVFTYCYQCVAGPDLLTVRIQDGVATEIIRTSKLQKSTRPARSAPDLT